METPYINVIAKHIKNKYCSKLDEIVDPSKPCTYKGIALKTLFLFLIFVMSGLLVSIYCNSSSIYLIISLFLVSLILGIIICLSIVFTEKLLITMSIIFSICEGVFLSTICCFLGIGDSILGYGIPVVLALIVVFMVNLFLFYGEVMGPISGNRAFLLSFLAGTILLIASVIVILCVYDISFLDFIVKHYISLIISESTIIIASIVMKLDFRYIANLIPKTIEKKHEWKICMSLVYIFVHFIPQLLIFLIITIIYMIKEIDFKGYDYDDL